MKDQHEKIKGYRDLSELEIKLMNDVKELAESVGDMVQGLESIDAIQGSKVVGGIDRRWLAIAKTDLQKGFMALTRSIAQPTTF